MHDVLVNRLGGLSLPRKSVVRLNDRPDMTLDVYRGRKTTMQQQQQQHHMQHDQTQRIRLQDFRIIKFSLVENSRWPPLLKVAKLIKSPFSPERLGIFG